MDESGLKVLTQEILEAGVIEELGRRAPYGGVYYGVSYNNYLVDGVYIPDMCGCGNLIFIFNNCKIVSLAAIKDQKFMYRYMLEFNNCEIVDYEKIGLHELLIEDRYSFSNCTFIKPVPLACPSEGEFIGWKSCSYDVSPNSYPNALNNNITDTCLVKLLIPADAKRSSGFGRKCRCSKAKVLGIFDTKRKKLNTGIIARSSFAPQDIINYEVGKMVYADSFDEDRYKPCSHGIHFFMTFNEALSYWY